MVDYCEDKSEELAHLKLIEEMKKKDDWGDCVCQTFGYLLKNKYLKQKST